MKASESERFFLRANLERSVLYEGWQARYTLATSGRAISELGAEDGYRVLKNPTVARGDSDHFLLCPPRTVEFVEIFSGRLDLLSPFVPLCPPWLSP